jgi:hypothetical protein
LPTLRPQLGVLQFSFCSELMSCWKHSRLGADRFEQIWLEEISLKRSVPERDLFEHFSSFGKSCSKKFSSIQKNVRTAFLLSSSELMSLNRYTPTQYVPANQIALFRAEI